jgi:Mg2+ and Co2+ transporter CorA
MIPNEKLAYLNGLIKGMKLTGESKEDKLFAAITDALNEMAEIFEGYDDVLDGMAEVLSDVEESVYELEDEVFGDRPEFGDYDSFDDEVYDITCSNCDKTITVDYDVLDSGAVICPGCGEMIEFTMEDEL